MPNKQDILLLIQKYQLGTATAAEIQILNEWYHSFNDSEVEFNIDEMPAYFEERLKNKILKAIRIREEIKIAKNRQRKWYMVAAAAAAVIIVTAMSYMFFAPKSSHLSKAEYAQSAKANDAAPGSNKAILTLANGTSVVLDSLSNGVINQQGFIKIQKSGKGSLAYTLNGNLAITKNNIAYNTISTPRGGQYQITLEDGTRVWLNAASSIRFPIAFTGNERSIEITGEAYFEVTKNKSMPFKVKAASSEIEVLGTHFNVNAYDDESSIKTTLFEGSVKVSTPGNNRSSALLQPGQQASIHTDGKISVNRDIDVEEVLAWKNGLFQYKGTDLQTILRQVSKWYDIDVEYHGDVNPHFTGQLKRELYASKVFEKLALTGEVHFKIEGKKVIVSP